MDDYITELTALLGQLDPDERNEVVDFYTEYLQDGNFTTYNDCVRELGTPRQLTRKILADYSIKNLDAGSSAQSRTAKPKEDMKTVWLIILAVLSTPVTIPLALGLAGLSIGVLAAFGIILGLLGLIFGVVVGGLASLVIGISILASDIWLGVLYTGIGIAFVGLIILLTPAFLAAFNGVVRGVTTFSRWAYQKIVPKNQAEKHGRRRQK